MRQIKTKITERKRGGAVGNLLTVILAFALLCAGVLLVSQHVGTVAAPQKKQQAGPQLAAQAALDAIRAAETALADENYGEARSYLARARNALTPHPSVGRTP